MMRQPFNIDKTKDLIVDFCKHFKNSIYLNLIFVNWFLYFGDMSFSLITHILDFACSLFTTNYVTRDKQENYHPINISETAVKTVDCFEYLWVHVPSQTTEGL